MRKLITRRLLGRFSKRYGYDAAYMESMLDDAPSAFFKFARIMAVASHRAVTPPEAYYAAKLVAAMAEDCGPCTQLVVNMAREAGVASDQIKAVLIQRVGAMSNATSIGFRFGRGLCDRSDDLDEVRERVRAEWGDPAVIELSLCVAIGRVFPMTKTGMGFAKACTQVEVSGKPVDVLHPAV